MSPQSGVTFLSGDVTFLDSVVGFDVNTVAAAVFPTPTEESENSFLVKCDDLEDVELDVNDSGEYSPPSRVVLSATASVVSVSFFLFVSRLSLVTAASSEVLAECLAAGVEPSTEAGACACSSLVRDRLDTGRSGPAL